MSTIQNPPPHPLADELPRWTVERMDLFVRTLFRTRNVAAAARAAGMSRQAAYRLRARLRGHPFDRAWTAAMAPRALFRQAIADHERGHAGLHGVTGDDTGLQRVTGGDASFPRTVSTPSTLSPGRRSG